VLMWIPHYSGSLRITSLPYGKYFACLFDIHCFAAEKIANSFLEA